LPAGSGNPAVDRYLALPFGRLSAEGDDTWRDFVFVARALGGQRSLDEIPLAARIAAATVEAFERR